MNNILNETFWFLCVKKRPQAEKKVKNPNICFANVIFLTRLAATGKAYYKTIKILLFTNQKYVTACIKTLNKQKYHTNKYMIDWIFYEGKKLWNKVYLKQLKSFFILTNIKPWW